METHEEWESRNARLAAEQKPHWIKDPAVRGWLYSILSAVVPLLVTLGVLTSEVGGHVLAIGSALLATGALVLAKANTPDR